MRNTELDASGAAAHVGGSGSTSTNRGTNTVVSTPVAAALRRLQTSPRLTAALRDAESLATAAVRSTQPAVDARRLGREIELGDDVSAIGAVHALGGVADPFADRMLIELLETGDQPLVSHAAWALGARAPSPSAVPLLEDMTVSGGFSGMLAERTLIEWARTAPDRVQAPQHSHDARNPVDRSHLRSSRHARDGVVVVQPFLHARLDSAGSSLGAGDAGGIASLLRSLGTSLARLDAIDEVITITRAEPDKHGVVTLSGHLGDAHRIERIPYGTAATVPWREAWQHRVLLERELDAIGRELGDRRVVWHLRMADVGTLAASAVARRLGHCVVFTAAPDPHVVLDALEADGRLDRARFGVEDAANQYWFRARMVERLSNQVDHLTLMPRPNLHTDLIELVGLDPLDLAHRSDVVPEGVDVTAVDEALARHAAGARGAVDSVLHAIPADRRSLPWLLTVGRLHPMKGAHRLVAAFASHPDLGARFNVVIVGGDVDDPSPDERSTLDLIHDASTANDGSRVDGVVVIGHRPPAEICDLLVHAAESGGVYVCASDKEEFGLAIVEALAAGMVVVAPQRGGPRTYVDGANGVLCDTASVAALADAIAGASAMADDRRRIQQSRTFVRAELSIETMAQRLADIYGALAPASSNVG